MYGSCCTDDNLWKMYIFLVCDKWVELPCDSEEAPEELEEHTMVAYQVIAINSKFIHSVNEWKTHNWA